MKQRITDAKRIVIKVGSSLLVNHETGHIHSDWLLSLIDEIAQFWQNNKQIIMVSSGAIALGRWNLQLKSSILKLEEKRAAASVGQIKFAHAYQEIFANYGITAAQILLTLDDSENRKRYQNAKNTLEILLKLRAVPIINENDSVTTTDIRYGDNDRLAARVAQMINADTLVLLSDIAGLYTANPTLNSDAKLIKHVTKITPELLAMAGNSTTGYGSGGMITKLAAAKIALASGCKMIIASGKHLHPLKRIDELDDNTWFIPEITPTRARKNWIAQHLKPKGSMMVDAGAMKALLQGKSLLPIGVIEIAGNFDKGDAIFILNENKEEIARGLTNYSAFEAKRIIGRKSSTFEELLGYRGCEEIIHRDDLVVHKGENIEESK